MEKCRFGFYVKLKLYSKWKVDLCLLCRRKVGDESQSELTSGFTHVANQILSFASILSIEKD